MVLKIRAIYGGDKLVIVDWYKGGKDTYDFMVRGDNVTFDDSEIRNDSEWVETLQHSTVLLQSEQATTFFIAFRSFSTDKSSPIIGVSLHIIQNNKDVGELHG